MDIDMNMNMDMDVDMDTAPKYSADNSTIQESQIKFKGPAGQEFASFVKQANYFLDEFSPNWKNYRDPKSYIIPPVFKFRHQDVSDEAFKELDVTRGGKRSHPIVNHRISDGAEFLVYNIIQKVANDKTLSPFIAIRSLDLHLNYDKERKEVTGMLTKIFPHIEWNNFHERLGKDNAEFDFALIGPKLGMVVIEVKSSYFQKPSYFVESEKQLPCEYLKGLGQLKSSDSLPYLLEECRVADLKNQQNSSCNDFPIKPPITVEVTKILVTPNLEKTRYNNWFNNLDTYSRQIVMDQVGTIVQWFKEDIIDQDSINLPAGSHAATNLRRFFDNILSSGSMEINSALYESYCPLLAGIASAKSMKAKKSDDEDDNSTVKMNRLDFSETENAIALHSSLVMQNPLQGQKSEKPTAASGLKQLNTVYYLTPDQQKALNGPNRQFILGVAGTGKTVVLQTKAVQLLEKGESVLVIAPVYFISNYQKLFNSHGFTNFKVTFLHCPELANIELKKITPGFTLADIEKHLAGEWKNVKHQSVRLFLSQFDNILIDDGVDTQYIPWNKSSRLLTSFFIMKLYFDSYPHRLIWVALDPLFRESVTEEESLVRLLMIGSKKRTQQPTFEFEVATLRQVLRCTGNVFSSVYCHRYHMVPEDILPTLGHKILGVEQTPIIFVVYQTLDETIGAASKEVENRVQRLLSQNVDTEDISVIAGDLSIYDEIKKLEKKWPALILRRWDNVSSLEWPFVIYAGPDPEAYYPLSLDSLTAEYRSVSRATTQLFRIYYYARQVTKTSHGWGICGTQIYTKKN